MNQDEIIKKIKETSQHEKELEDEIKAMKQVLIAKINMLKAAKAVNSCYRRYYRNIEKRKKIEKRNRHDFESI